MTIKLAIHGAAGRMGKRLVALGCADSDFDLVAAIDSEASPELGKDAGLASGISEVGIPFSAQWPEIADVAIDFSIPAACETAVRQCLKTKTPIVVATTGLSDAQCDLVRDASKSIPVCWAPSMSLAVNLTMKLVQQTAAALKTVSSGVDVEIVERHHRFKVDSPSGTALKFGSIIAEEMGITNHVHGREGECGARTKNEIGYHAIRTGDDPGQHTIIFGMLGEIIELRVGASNRDCYAQGALAAAKFLANKAPGLYDMFDVLGLK